MILNCAQEGVYFIFLVVLSVTRFRPPLGQVLVGTLNHTTCNVYLPKAFETLIHKMLQILFSFLCVKYSFFWFYQSIRFEAKECDCQNVQGLPHWQGIYHRTKNRDFQIPGRLTLRTVILRAEDWTETVVFGGKLSTLRSGLLEQRTAANVKFLALFLNHGIF